MKNMQGECHNIQFECLGIELDTRKGCHDIEKCCNIQMKEETGKEIRKLNAAASKTGNQCIHCTRAQCRSIQK